MTHARKNDDAPRTKATRTTAALIAAGAAALVASGAALPAGGPGGAETMPEGPATLERPADARATQLEHRLPADARATQLAHRLPAGERATPAGTASSLEPDDPIPARLHAGFSSGRAGFSMAFREIDTPYRRFLLTATPGERVRLDAVPRDDDLVRPAANTEARFAAAASAGTLSRAGSRAWIWTAPGTPGHYRVRISDRTAGETVTLSAAVLAPMSRLEGGRVRGYRIGSYPERPYRGLPQYESPPGFLLLQPEHAEIPVSPHFTLGQFPAKGPAGWPKYLVLDERLLLKLELLLEEANRRGIHAPTFQVLSGFRSPWYNHGIGRPKYSRHIYGDAADIYVDVDADGRMDDLNGDGRVDLRDAGLLYDIVEEMDGAEERAHLLGGLGKYPTTPAHGPFIHVDTRLYRARW